MPKVRDKRQNAALRAALGARVIGYYLETSTRAAVARNEGREGKARVPKVAIFTSAKRLVPPALDEGSTGCTRSHPFPDRPPFRTDRRAGELDDLCLPLRAGDEPRSPAPLALVLVQIVHRQTCANAG